MIPLGIGVNWMAFRIEDVKLLSDACFEFVNLLLCISISLDVGC